MRFDKLRAVEYLLTMPAVPDTPSPSVEDLVVPSVLPVVVVVGPGTAEVAATRIIRIASWISRLRPPSPQNVWPRILFMAGIETTDPVYQDWVVRALADAEAWGANFGKTRVLLERVLKVQSEEGKRVDYLQVMKRSTGLFRI